MSRRTSKILIRGTNWIGDSVISVPALREIRRIFPESHLALLVKPWVRDLFVGADLVNEIIVYDRRPGLLSFLQFAGFLRQQKFDAAILLQNAFEAAALAYWARIPIRIGYPTDGRRFLLTHLLKLSKPVRHEHQIYHYLNIVAQIESIFRGESRVDYVHPQYKLAIKPEVQSTMRNQLHELGWETGRHLIAINPGATNNPLKRWPPDRFARLADKILERRDCTVALIGASSEEGIANEIISLMHNRAIKLTGRTSLLETIAVLSICNLVISNDTGPAYISAALCRPTITIFGPTNYNIICPTSPTSHLLHHPISCSFCRVKFCPINHECMKLVTVDEVYKTALELLMLSWNRGEQ